MNQNIDDINTKEKVVIALVHNNNKNRNNYLFPLVRNLEERIEEKLTVFRIDSWYQPKLHRNDYWKCLKARYFLMNVQIQWTDYIKLHSGKLILNKIKIWLMFVINVFLNSNANRKYTEVEKHIAAKHIKIWQSFLESNANYLIIFEDDIIFKHDSINKTFDTINKISLSDAKCPVYIDIAGGYSNKENQIEKLVYKRQNEFLYFSKPVTNTVCGYMINKSLAEIFINHINADKNLLLLPIDWCINKIFIDLQYKKQIVTCLHADPSIYIHGSMKGYYKEWRN